MRRVMLMLALLLAIVGLGGIPAQAAVPVDYTPVGPGKVYLALGDSLTTGSNGQVDSSGNRLPTTPYPRRLFERLRTPYPELRLISIGRDGETSATMLNGGQIAQAELLIATERAAGRNVGLVTLGIGGNDMVAVLLNNADPQATLESFTVNLNTILDRLVAALTVNGARQGDLILIDYYNAYPGMTLFNDPRGPLTDTWLPRFNAAIKKAAADRRVPVAEVAQAFVGREASLVFVQREQCLEFVNAVQTCGFHPTNAGQQVIANQILDVSRYSRFTYLPSISK